MLPRTLDAHLGASLHANQRQAIVFLVGMPRSGTKLLRDLLNRHTDISIFPNESHFIPAFNRRYGARSDLSNIQVFRRLFRDFRTTTFCRRLEMRGIRISEADWRQRSAGSRYSDVLRAMFACYRAQSGATIVGDKTPEYVTQVPLLSGLLPEARFVHIVRDPRDYALSMRKAWGKNIFRAAYRWKLHVRKYCKDVSSLSVAQITVRYEDLLASPAGVLTRICDFLGVPFQPQMMSLEVSSEELGDAKGLTTVLTQNTRKWVDNLSTKELRTIDSIAGVVMGKFGYVPTNSAGDEDLSWFTNFRCRTIDAINMLQFLRRTEGGLMAALLESWRTYRHSGVDE